MTTRLLKHYKELHDGLSDMIEGKRLERVDIPEDYRWLIHMLVKANEIKAEEEQRRREETNTFGYLLDRLRSTLPKFRIRKQKPKDFQKRKLLVVVYMDGHHVDMADVPEDSDVEIDLEIRNYDTNFHDPNHTQEDGDGNRYVLMEW